MATTYQPYVFYDTFANFQANTFNGQSQAKTGSICVTTDTNQSGYYNAVTGQVSWFN